MRNRRHLKKRKEKKRKRREQKRTEEIRRMNRSSGRKNKIV